MWQVFWVFAVLLVLIFTGLPVYLALLLTSVVFMVGMDLPLNLLVIKMFGGVNSSP